ncbi:unnamed protein product [Closterium sp. Yama58-4]|nr:unnamed protein product [Closterium sp. Yama58-4]
MQSARGEEQGRELPENHQRMADGRGGMAEVSWSVGNEREIRGENNDMAEITREVAEESQGLAGESSRTGRGSLETTEANKSSYNHTPSNHTRAGKRKRVIPGDVLLELGEAAPTGFKRLLSVAGVLPEIHRRLRRSNATVLAPSDAALAALLPSVLPLALWRLEALALFPRQRQNNLVFPRKLKATQQGARRRESSAAGLGIRNEQQLGELRQGSAQQLGSAERRDDSSQQLGSAERREDSSQQQGSAERREVLREIALCHVIPARVSLLQWRGEHRSLQGTRLSLASSGLRFIVSNVHVSSVGGYSVPVSKVDAGSVLESNGTLSSVAVTVGATVVTQRLVVYTVEGILLPLLLGASVSIDGTKQNNDASRRERGSWRERGRWKDDSDQGVDDPAAVEIKNIEQPLQEFLDRRSGARVNSSFSATTISGAGVMVLLVLLAYRIRYKNILAFTHYNVNASRYNRLIGWKNVETRGAPGGRSSLRGGASGLVSRRFRVLL